jgi:hypothetical protein
MEVKKRWFASKTLWTAAVSFAVVVTSALFADQEVANKVQEVGVLVLPLLMVLLRLITGEPVGK